MPSPIDEIVAGVPEQPTKTITVPSTATYTPNANGSGHDDRDTALRALAALKFDRCDTYAEWIGVGQMLHAVDPSSSMCAEWDSWSRQSGRHQDGVCAEKWATFDANGGLKIGSLISLAQEDSPGFRAHPERARAQSSIRLEHSELGNERDLAALIEDARDLLDRPPPEPAQLIKGIAYAGSKMTLSSNSKGKKTWLQMHLAACVATGQQWLAHEVAQGRVLYINLELQKWSFNRRLAALERAIGSAIPRGYLDALHLRGRRVRVEQLANMRLESGRYSLICCDPLYKLHGGRSENDASEMADLLWCLETMAANANAALLIAHHFAKGNAGSKNAIDRASGSGVLARDGDSILVMTEHEEPDAITLECILRDFPPVEPRALRWEFPVFVPDSSLEPCKHAQTGRPKKGTPRQAADLLALPMMYKQAVSTIQGGLGVGVTKAKELLASALRDGLASNEHGLYQRK